MISKEDYLTGVLSELERRKKEGKSGLIRLNANVSLENINHIKKYFSDKPKYLVEIENRCTGCTNKWDIVILFL
jgi:hypothetical protein